MRLIDADELIERMGKWMTKACGRVQTVEERVASDITVSVYTEIEETPTAFDKEKVMEELNSERNLMYREDGTLMGARTQISIDRAVDIVEKGGIE